MFNIPTWTITRSFVAQGCYYCSCSVVLCRTPIAVAEINIFALSAIAPLWVEVGGVALVWRLQRIGVYDLM